MNEFLIILTVALCTGVGFYIGRELGNKRGRDEQWIADYFDTVKQLREQRDELGKFKTKKAHPNLVVRRKGAKT